MVAVGLVTGEGRAYKGIPANQKRQLFASLICMGLNVQSRCALA